MPERRNRERKEFSYYMRLIDNVTEKLVGHLVDISPGGFRLDSQDPIPKDREYQFRMDLAPEVADKPSMTFAARSIWCHVDPEDPLVYNVGFQLEEITPEDHEIFRRVIYKYGRRSEDKDTDTPQKNFW